MSALTALTRLETRLFLRDPVWLIFGLIFPPLLLLAMGYLFPGFDEPLAELDGDPLISVYTPTVIGLGLAMLALMALPMTLATYRESGILRRMRTTPVHPRNLLFAQVSVNAGVAVVGSTVAVVIAKLAFDVPFPELPIWFGISFVLGVSSMFALGLLIGAVSRSATTAQVFGFVFFFPMLFFAGVYVPKPMMSDGLTTISNLTPLGAAVQAMMDAASGVAPSPQLLVVMVVWAAILGVTAIRLFRWE